MRYQFLRFPDGKSKAVTLSYDDGNRSDLQLADVISKAGLKCTFNLNGNIMKKGIISDDEIREHFLDKGHEIAVHGENHSAPGKQRPIEGIKGVLNCRLELEERFGHIIRGMAYPDSGIRVWENGADYETIKRYLTDLDIAYARTLGGDNDKFYLPTDWHCWMPTAHHVNPKLMEYIDKFLNLNIDENYISGQGARLFYLWGHAYEFERDNNWDFLDEICEKLGGHEDIWYATNMEIYNYVQAYNSLEYSADSNIIYNPTLYTIWFKYDEAEYSIKSGETLHIK